MSNSSFGRIALLSAALCLASLASGFADPAPGISGLIVTTKDGPLTLSSSPVLPKEADGSTYGPENLLDGKLDTAWCPVDRASPWVRFDFPRRSVNYISVANGYQRITAKGTKLFKANARVAVLRVEDSNGAVVTLELTDADGTQDWTQDWTLPLSSRFGQRVTSLRFTIESIYPGSKWQDVLLSSLEFGHAEADDIGKGG